MTMTVMLEHLRLQQHAADDTDSWHSDVETSSHELFGYTSDNSLPEDTQDTDVGSIIPGYTAYLSSVDGGLKARPEMYGTAVKQIITAVGNNMETSTKENVARQYVEKMMNEVSNKTLANKLRSLQYSCGYVINVVYFDQNNTKCHHFAQRVCQTGERH